MCKKKKVLYGNGFFFKQLEISRKYIKILTCSALQCKDGGGCRALQVELVITDAKREIELGFEGVERGPALHPSLPPRPMPTVWRPHSASDLLG